MRNTTAVMRQALILATAAALLTLLSGSRYSGNSGAAVAADAAGSTAPVQALGQCMNTKSCTISSLVSVPAGYRLVVEQISVVANDYQGAPVSVYAAARSVPGRALSYLPLITPPNTSSGGTVNQVVKFYIDGGDIGDALNLTGNELSGGAVSAFVIIEAIVTGTMINCAMTICQPIVTK